MWTKDGKEWNVTVISIPGVVEESCLLPLTSTDVGLGWKLAHHPAIWHIDRN